jgi:hypothetical protein
MFSLSQPEVIDNYLFVRFTRTLFKSVWSSTKAAMSSQTGSLKKNCVGWLGTVVQFGDEVNETFEWNLPVLQLSKEHIKDIS